MPFDLQPGFAVLPQRASGRQRQRQAGQRQRQRGKEGYQGAVGPAGSVKLSLPLADCVPSQMRLCPTRLRLYLCKSGASGASATRPHLQRGGDLRDGGGVEGDAHEVLPAGELDRCGQHARGGRQRPAQRRPESQRQRPARGREVGWGAAPSPAALTAVTAPSAPAWNGPSESGSAAASASSSASPAARAIISNTSDQPCVSGCLCRARILAQLSRKKETCLIARRKKKSNNVAKDLRQDRVPWPRFAAAGNAPRPWRSAWAGRPSGREAGSGSGVAAANFGLPKNWV